MNEWRETTSGTYEEDPGQQDYPCQPGSVSAIFHSLVTISFPSLK